MLSGINVQTLLSLYSLCLMLNLVIAFALAIRNRHPLHRNLLFLWVATTLSFLINGLTSGANYEWITVGWSSIVLITLTTALLLSDIGNFKLPLKLYAVVFLVGVFGSTLAAIFMSGFLYLSLPVTLGAVFIQADATVKAIQNWNTLHRASKLLVIISAAHVLHILDYPFLRDDPTGAAFGFTVAFVLLLAQSIVAPAAIIETINQANLAHVTSLNKAFYRFVPEQLLQHLSKGSIVDIDLGDNIGRDMTVMFTDIRGFTTRSEKMSAQEVFDFLNEYLSEMQPIISKHGGFIDKFVGDAIMALFPDSKASAINAAIEMRAQLSDYNERMSKLQKQPVEMGIGINTGPLILGTIGNPQRMEGTVIGDTVNVASRLEGLTKNYGVGILVSHQGREISAIEAGMLPEMRLVDKVAMQGKSEPLQIFEVLDGLEDRERENKIKTRSLFENAVRDFHTNKLNEAKAGFDKCIEMSPTDEVAKHHLATVIKEMRTT